VSPDVVDICNSLRVEPVLIIIGVREPCEEKAVQHRQAIVYIFVWRYPGLNLLISCYPYLKAAFNMNNKRPEPTERHVGGAIAEELGSSAMKGYTEQDRRDMWRMGKKQELR